MRSRACNLAAFPDPAAIGCWPGFRSLDRHVGNRMLTASLVTSLSVGWHVDPFSQGLVFLANFFLSASSQKDELSKNFD